MDSCQLLKISLQQGMDELARNPEKTYKFRVMGGFNFLSSANQEAVELEKALDRNIGQSGVGLGDVLKSVFAKSVTDGNRDLRIENKAGALVCQSRDLVIINSAIGTMFDTRKTFKISIMPVVS